LTGVLIIDAKVSGLRRGSVYCEGGRVVSVSSDETQRVPEGTQTIDAKGGSVFPGFIDTHCHPFDYGWLKRSVDLRGVANATGIRQRLLAGIRRAGEGEWVTGMGWDQEVWPGRKMPVREDIDVVSPSNPVALSRICGHVALLNSRAIDLLGLEGKRGDEYERDEAGRLTGIVKEKAVAGVFEGMPRSPQWLAADLQSVEAEAARLGLTSLHTIVSTGGFREELEAIAQLDAAGSLSLRHRVYVPPEALGFVEEKGLREKFAGGMVRLNGVKIFADGSFGARTAALREPYADDPRNLGLLRYRDEELARLVEKVDRLGLQAIVHAIGDRAVEQAAEAIGAVSGTKNPRRHRIEHASLLPRDLLSKMARHGIRAAVQPLFVTSDLWATQRLGEERAKDLYPFRSMLGEGIIVSGSSDSPVESLSPVLGIWAAMTRGGANPNESLGLDDSLSLYTSNAAANGFDDENGLLAEGAPADLTVVDSDTEGMHPALLRKVGVLATVVGGSVAHSFGSG
jgi:hypothetical protein